MDLVNESQAKLENEYSVFCATGSHSSFWKKVVLFPIFPKFHLSILNPPDFLDFGPLSTGSVQQSYCELEKEGNR